MKQFYTFARRRLFRMLAADRIQARRGHFASYTELAVHVAGAICVGMIGGLVIGVAALRATPPAQTVTQSTAAK